MADDTKPTEERNSFCAVRTCLMATATALEGWMNEEPRIRHLCSPVLVWLLDAAPSLNDLPASEPQSDKMPHKKLIEQLLLVIQGILSLRLSFPPLDLDEPPDSYVSQCERLSGNVSQVIAIESVVRAVNAFTDDLIVSPPAGRLAMIQTVLPFLDAYLHLVQNYLIVQVQFVKSSFKLSYVLCRVVLSLAQKGFCKPAELDEESTGDAEQGDEVLDGAGLGHGTGSKNVSDQIQDESQVEGLRDEETTKNEPASESDGDAIEMGDLGGDIEDLDGDNTEGGSDDESRPEIDEEVGKTDATNPDTVNEKLWGDEKVAGEKAEGRSSKEGSKEQNEPSEVVAKENQEKHTSKQDDGLLNHTSEELADEEMPDDHPVDAGRQMDNFVPEADTLDLPDDLELSTGDNEQDEHPDTQDDAMNEGEDEHHQSFPASRDPEPVQDEPFDAGEDDVPVDPEDSLSDSHEIATPDAEGDQLQASATQPDISEGNNQSKESSMQNPVDSPSDGRSQGAKEAGATAGNEVTETNEVNEGNVRNDRSVLSLFFFGLNF